MTYAARISILVLAAACATALPLAPARANAVVNLCLTDDQPGPGTNLASAFRTGGRITFNCPAGATIEVRNTLSVQRATELDGGTQGITLQLAADLPLIFNSQHPLDVRSALLIGNRGANSTALYTLAAPVTLDKVRIRNFRVGLAVSAAPLRASEVEFSSLDWGIVAHSVPTFDLTVALFDEVRSGPLRIFGGTVTLERVTVDNSGPSTINLQAGSPCAATITKSFFSRGTSSATDGGALVLGCDTTIDHTDFTRNRSDQNGGAIRITDTAANVSLRRVKFSNNSSGKAGGAIAIEHASPATSLRIEMRYVSFLGNRAGTRGGAISYDGARSARLIAGAALFTGNSANEGGALWWGNAILDMDRAIFKSNQAQTGGGLYFLGTFSGSALSNCVFTQNTGASGGAFYGRGIQFLNCTVAGNSGPAVLAASPASAPAGPASDHTISLLNSIIAVNNGVNCAAQNGVTVEDRGHNLQFPDASCGATIAVADPKLDSMFVPDYFSPAFQAGDNNVCLKPPVNRHDVFGQPRPQGGICTIGAVEGELQEILYRRRFKAIRRGEPRAPSWWNWDFVFGKLCCRD